MIFTRDFAAKDSSLLPIGTPTFYIEEEPPSRICVGREPPAGDRRAVHPWREPDAQTLLRVRGSRQQRKILPPIPLWFCAGSAFYVQEFCSPASYSLLFVTYFFRLVQG
jgi:hypothetical protein